FIAFQRYDGAGGVVVVAASFANGDHASYRIGIPTGGNWTEVLNSRDAAYGGSGPTNPGTLTASAVPYDGFGHSLDIALPAMGVVVLSNAAVTGVAGDEVRASLGLRPPHPNPSAAGVRIAFDLPAAGWARIAVYDVAGRLVRTIADGVHRAGAGEVAWDGADGDGRPVAAGVYMVRVESGDEAALRKVILLR
ncbi:T9SS type A sorting domain-containing protein, partial [bacterium]|nr:T9SS type A sorting domain-containing protein [bacterium]